MDFLLEALTNWLKEMLVGGIMSNLSGMFDSVNQQVADLFHELRHALQYLHPERFDGLISRSRLYVIQYDGTCYKLVDGKWKECKLDGSIDYFTELYLGQPYEREANDFAYEKVKALLGDALDITDLRYHHEIYLSDARKTAPDKLKTVIRHPTKKV